METQMQDQAAHTINANHDPKVDVKEITFNFRKTKDAETGVETKREAVVARLAIPSVEGIVAILEAGGKGLELLLSAASLNQVWPAGLSICACALRSSAASPVTTKCVATYRRQRLATYS